MRHELRDMGLILR